MTVEGMKVQRLFRDLVESTEVLLSQEEVRPQDGRSATVEGGLNKPYYDCCDNPRVFGYRGEYVCRNCATVHEPVMTYDFSVDKMKNTVHVEKKQNYPYQDHGCRTSFSLDNLTSNQKFLYWRLLKLNSYFRNSIEANMKIANQVLYKIAGQLEIPKSIHRHALRIYQKVLEKKLTVGRGIRNLMTASLFIACNLSQFRRSLQDFARVSQIPLKTLRKNYRLILEHLNIRLNRTRAPRYIKEFSIRLGLPVPFQRCASEILKKLTAKGINTSGNPKGYAAAIIYFLAKIGMGEKRLRQKDVSDISSTSEVTIRKYIKVLKQNRDLFDFIGLVNK